jgi:NAD(P) transhydrogenase subunit alpha
MPQVFVPRERKDGETRVAATPDSVRLLVRTGLSPVVQAGAGAGAGFPDDAYREAGAEIAPDATATLASADVVLLVNPPDPEQAAGMKQGALLLSFLYPHLNEETVKALNARSVTAFAVDLVPRISRAQSMDALSSQSNLAGYKAVVMAAERLGKIFPLLMTAAGTIKPARVVVLGAGVAGLQAVATAKRLGAVVEVSDIRPAVKEQVESLGGRFIDMPTPEDSEDAGGYAREVGEDFLARQREILTEHVAQADAVVTTALVPGRPAPVLLTEEMVAAMRPGSVIVDLAAVMGGNCALTEPGRTVEREGVAIVGETNVPGLVAADASEMYARNLVAALRNMLREGELLIDFEDELTAGAVVCQAGEVRHGA